MKRYIHFPYKLRFPQKIKTIES